jgi:hypothetical protein
MRLTRSTTSLAQDEISVSTITRSNIKSSFFSAKAARLPAHFGQGLSLPIKGVTPKITPTHASVTGNRLMTVYLNSLIFRIKTEVISPAGG